MIEGLFELNIEAALLSLLLWASAAAGAGRLALRRTPAALRRRARLGLLLIAAGLLAVVLRAYAAVALTTGGWALAADFVLVAAPPLVLPGLAVLALSVPRYWRLARAPLPAPAEGPVAADPVEASAPPASTGTGPGSPRPVPDAATRAAAADPALVVPVQATAVGALVGAVLTVSPPVEPYLPDLGLALLVVALAGVALWSRHRARAVRVGRPGYVRPPWWARWLASAARVTALALVFALGLGVASWTSRLPDEISMAGHDGHEETQALGPEGVGHRSVDQLTGPTGTPDRSFTLTARSRRLRLASGESVAAYAFDGQLPGPTLRVRQGQLVEVNLVNDDVAEGVTIHWHGLHVPNAMDGVAGATQDAVRPGGRYRYLFRAEQVGTFWYHSHQQSAAQVFRGLFGALVVDPPAGPPAGVVDLPVVAHAWDVGGIARTAFGNSTGVQRQTVPQGRRVRLRLVNADNCPRTWALTGAAYRVVAIDGVDVSGPGELTGTQVRVAGGGRYDLEYVQPAGTVQLSVTGDANGLPSPFGFNEGCGEDNRYGEEQHGRDHRSDRSARERLALLLGPAPTGTPQRIGPGPVLDPLGYGTPAAVPFDAHSHFDREYDLRFGLSFGFYDGRFTGKWTINNASFPDAPAQVVREGDRVRFRFTNRSLDDHPVHVHGHHLLVLSRNGRVATGSPWWTDTLNVAPGEQYEVGLVADNPGIWMDHCHNLEHAQVGMVMHLSYMGISTPYRTGRATVNHPE